MTWRETVELVKTRSGGRCEYCRMHHALQGATFHVEHIIPRSRGGGNDVDNFAWCCPSCNLHKADRTEVIDSSSGSVVPLFHPRQHDGNANFRWSGYQLQGHTAVGRATIQALDINNPRRVLVRRAEELFGLFPT